MVSLLILVLKSSQLVNPWYRYLAVVVLYVCCLTLLTFGEEEFFLGILYICHVWSMSLLSFESLFEGHHPIDKEICLGIANPCLF
ncbi:hypothetical protein CPB84DRAFT_1781569 [Gymnopilus junonius]|uniref:Uncharacterized protein n=1 Tax=Gymnopilus junonius TaxID=109634 RepID=A0A9P5TLD3_GYMJU|nr:hypothetical protein CPB84DRAFT_1781569 [Gymnopilus junonius]